MHTLKFGALYFPEPSVCYFTDAIIQDMHDHFNITDYIDYCPSYLICCFLLLKLRLMHQTQTTHVKRQLTKVDLGDSTWRTVIFKKQKESTIRFRTFYKPVYLAKSRFDEISVITENMIISQNTASNILK